MIEWFCVLNPDFCRKISIKYPSSPINTRLGGFVILSDFHGVSALELGVWKIFYAIKKEIILRHTSVKRNRYKPEAKGFSIKNHKVLLYRISWVYKRYKMLLPHRKQRSEDPKPENDFQEFLYTYKKRLVSERFRLKFLPQVRKKCRDRILLFWEVWEERMQA